MKNTLHFTFFRTLLVVAFGLFFNLSWGQGSEDFGGIPAASSTSSIRTWTGNNGIVWTATDARTDQTLATGNKAINIRNGELTFGLTSVQLNSGLGNLTLKAKAPFGSDNGSLQLIVNGTLVSAKSVSGNSISTVTWSTVNITTLTSVVVKQVNNNARITIDDVEWTGYSSTTPALTVSSNTLPAFGATAVNAFSTSSSFSVSGSNLTEAVSINAPENFEVSVDQASWGSSAIIPNSATLTNIPVYVRFHPLSSGLKSGNVTFMGGGVTTFPTVAVSGEGIQINPEPSNYVSNFSAIANSHAQISVTWNDALGANLPAGYLLLVNQTGTFSAPVDGTDAIEDVDLSDGSGVFKIAQGLQTKLLTGLSPLTTYHFVIYPYSNSQNFINYKTDGVAPNANATTLVAPAVCGTEDFANLNLGSSYASGSFVGNNGVAWSYVESRDENNDSNNSGINGKAIMLRNASSRITSSSIPNGIGSFSVKLYKGFTSASNRQVELFINGVSKGLSISFQSTAEQVFTVDNINVGGNVVIEVRNNTGNQVILDDLTWTCYVDPNQTTWNGTAWSNGTPSATLDAIIAGDYNTATNGTFTAKSLTVNSGVFTVASGTSVTVENGVTSAGVTNFIVKNNANLIQTSSVANTGAITVERESAQLVRLDHTLWSSPVATQKLFAFSPNTLTNRFYTYATATNNYVNTGLSATTDFIVGKGYGVRAPNDHSTTPATWTGSFKGVPNNGNVSFTLSTAGQGFNLVGNPYPSVVDGAALVAANSTKINGTLYFYAHTLTMNAQGAFPAGTNYALWNATGQTAATTGTSGVPALVPNGKIQVGQGFLVKSTALGGDVMFNNTMREANTANQFFRLAPVAQATSEVEKHRLWLNLTNAEGTTFNQILIGYVAGATQEIDNLYDGLSFGNEGSALSSRLSNEDYTIQGRALPFNVADVVPLGFKAMTPGNYTISLSDRDGVFAADQNVFLKDNANGSINNIKTAPYTFTAQAGTFNNRFEVVYQSTLSTPESTFNSSSVVAYVKEAQLNIQTKGNSMKAVSVYDVRGRLLFSKSEINATDFVAQGLTTQNQVLLVQVTAENGEVATVKVIF